MIKLLMIADDFTGALDTGVQLAARGANIHVTIDPIIDESKMATEVDVLVIDSETRHLAKEEAYEMVSSIVRQSRKIGIPYIYKKTDSALRGNVGAEIAAVLEASGKRHLHFIPAYPQMGRTTINGVQYVDDLPVAQSVFGDDPFEPVQFSSVSDIIRSQSSLSTCNVAINQEQWEALDEGILIHDAKTLQDLEHLATLLKSKEKLYLLAGCAGFASILPDVLGISGQQPRINPLGTKLFIACGSINPVSVAQCTYAKKHGAAHYYLTPEQKLDRNWPRSSAADLLCQKIIKTSNENSIVILNANGPGEPELTYRYVKEQDIVNDHIRTDIVNSMSYLMEQLINDGLNSTLFIMGGDLLLQFIKQLGINTISPLSELEIGVVLSEIVYEGKTLNIISKSGGFGDEALFVKISEKIKTM